MAKASLWTRVKKKVRKWFSGDDSRKATPPAPRAVAVNRDARNQTVSSSVNKRAFVSSLNDTKREQREEKRVQDAFKASKQTYKSMAEAVSNGKSDSTKTPPKPKTSLEKLDATLKKDVPKDPKVEAAQKSHDNLQNALEERRRKKQMARAEYKDYKERVGRDARHEAFHEATHHRYDVAQEGISDEEREARIQAIRTAPLYEMMHGRDDEALDVAKAKMKYQKRLASALRGAANIASASTVDFAANKSKGGYKEAEEYYQENKDPLAEGIGSLVGGALLYGGTAPTFDALGVRGVERAATTQIGKKLGAEKLAKLMAGKGAKSAFARSLVGSGLQDSTIGLLDSTMRAAQRDDLETPSDYLKEVAKWQGLNYLYGLGGNAIFHGLPAAGRAWSNFADESRRLYAVPKEVADVAETTAKSAPPKATAKAAIAEELGEDARKALRAERNELDDEWWALSKSIEEDFGAINPDYRTLTPEQRVDIVSRKTRMQEITARRNEIVEELRGVKRADGGANIDVPEKSAYNNIQEGVDNGTEIGNIRGTQAGGETVSGVDAEISARGGDDNSVVAGVADASENAGRRSGDGVLRVDSKTRAKLTESGVTDTHLSDVSDNYATFSDALEAARKSNRFGGYVDPKSVDELVEKEAKTFLSGDGQAGAAVEKDGNISAVFKNPASKYKGAVYDLLFTARANGGTKMDCFGAELANMYEGCGFTVVGRVKNNPEYVTDPLLKELQPDVYILMKNTDDLDTVASKIGKPESAGGYHRSTQEELDALPLFGKDDYEAAKAYRDGLLAQQEAGMKAKAKKTTAKTTKVKTEVEAEAKAKGTKPATEKLDEAAEVKAKSKTKSKGKTEAKGEPKAEAEAEVKSKSKSKTKTEAKKTPKADDSRYNELVAERKQILDEYMSKNERMDNATAERLKEINAELDNIKPPKSKGKGKRTKAEAPKQEMKLPETEAKTPETKGVKEAAKTLEPKAEKAAKAEAPDVKAEAGEAAKTSKVKKYEVQVEDSKGDFHKVTVEAESSSKARRAAMAEVNESLDHDVSVVDGKTLGRVEETAKVENLGTKTKTQKAKTQSKGVKETAETLEPKAAKGKKVKSEPAGEGNVVKENGVKTESKNATQKVEQKDFDKDFAEFRKKVGNAKSEILELENKLRVAETKEQKAAIKAQIKALKDDVKKAHNKAGLRYHPDKGGSAEQMAKFNEAYDTFVNGGNGGGTGGSKNVKPTRNVKKVEDIVNKTKEGRSAKEDVENAWQAARRSTTNSMVTFEDTNLKTIKTDYEGWKSRNASVDKARRYNALATRSVSEGQLRADGSRYSGTVERVGADGKTYEIQNGKSLKEIYAGLDADKEAAFDAYLLLRHAPDRIREATPIFKRINLVGEDGSIIKSLDDPEVVKEYADKLLSENPDFARRAEELYQYEQNELENRVRAGLMSQETASKWAHDHPFYVPSGRDGYFNAVYGNHKGVVGADSLKAATGSDLDIRSIKEQLAEATSRNWRDITSNELLEEFFGSEIAAGRSDTKGLKMLNDTFGLSKSADGRKFYAKIFREGKMHRVEISKNHYYDLVDLYKNGRLGGDGAIGDVMDTVSRATSKVSTPFKKLVTTWNPIFLPKNFSRDMQDALINTRQTKEFVECLAPAWKQLREGGEYARAFEDSGVSQANFVNLGESLNRGGKLGKAVDKFIALQDMTESFPRLAEYMATLKKAGVDISKPLSEQSVSPKLLDIAAANAADVTVNFGRSGSVGKNLNKGLVPFLNPSIQGWSKFVRNFREHQSTKQLLGVIAKATALGAGVMGVNNFLLSDNPNYQQISNREKATNIIIAIPPFKDGHINNDADTFIKIPRGRFAAVYGLATVNAFNDNEMGWAEMIKVARDQVLPVDPTESSIVAPLYAAHKNETWYGAPIESDYLVENFSPSERYDERTTPLGKALGKATSGLPEELQISPKKADYMIDAATGVIGDFGMPIATALGNKNGISDVPAAGVGVLKKAFTIDSATQNGLTSQYNSQKELLTHKKNGANASEADEKAYDKFNSWDSRVKAASNAMRYVQNSDLPNKQEAYRELAKLRNDNMQKALNGKRSINNSRDIDIIHKYAGTSYTIENLGKSADQKALKAYSAAVYGNLSEDEMRKRIDSDTEFYKGYKGIVKTQNALQKVNPKLKGGNALTYAVGLADAGANDDVFASYDTTIKSRTESASKAQRAKDYLKNSGSVEEFAQLENAVKSLGKLSDYDRGQKEDEAYAKLQRGLMSIDEYNTELDKIAYNANQSYVGKAVSLAMSGAPARAYNLYDVNARNVQKGYNLAAMGIDSRKYREMSQACDKDGNGYLKTAEIRDYVANSDIEDKATLFDALCYYPNVRNPFGTPNRYSAEQAAEMGARNGVTQINVNAGVDNTVLAESGSNGSSYSGYGGGGHYGGYRHRSGGGGMRISALPKSNYKASKQTYKDTASLLRTARKSNSTRVASTVKVEPPTVKFKKYEV